MGQWLHSLITDTVTATLQIAKRAYSLAREQNSVKAYFAQTSVPTHSSPTLSAKSQGFGARDEPSASGVRVAILLKSSPM